jgi:lipopolysaccharide transport system ATP-binding protein
MNPSAIQVQGLSKRYRIGKSMAPDNGRRRIMDWRVSPFEYLATTLRAPAEDEILWALKDVSFEVGRGEVIGIIGPNGAGKSTLLKVLSRITEPTSGRALLFGRVGSLLEIGTGFHPELTGRENIYLSGAILGMRRAEVDQKFDEIAAFAEVDRFLDTPVKRYSSWMYVRLAFAVAAHLETEILLMDEVLAVGDAAFQKKCLGKMGDVATQGRTVLFVSHNLVAVQNLCARSIWIRDGQVAENGPTKNVVGSYLATASQAAMERIWSDPATAPGNDKVRLHRVAARPAAGSSSDLITMETPLSVEIEFWNLTDGERLHAGLRFFTDEQVVAFSTAANDRDPEAGSRALPAGLVRSVCHVPAGLLNEAPYRLSVLIFRNSNRVIYRMDEALVLDVLDMGMRPGARYGREPGVVRPFLHWTTELAGHPAATTGA